MAVFRVVKNENHTVMSSYHLRDKSISLKAKGLLSQLLCQPDSWDHTLEGITELNMERTDELLETMNELIGAGYILREKDVGQETATQQKYVIFELPLFEASGKGATKILNESCFRWQEKPETIED